MKSNFVLFALLASLSSFSIASTDDESIEIWLFALFSPEVGKSKAREFVNQIHQETGKNYYAVSSSDKASLVKRCLSGKKLLIIGSQSLIQEVNEKCQLTSIVKSYQEIHLFKNKGAMPQNANEVRRLGLVRNIKASSIADRFLADFNSEYYSIYYPNIFELIRHHKRDKIDAIALPISFIKQASEFSKEWESMIVFEEKGVGMAAVSRSVDSKTTTEIQSFLLSGDDAVTETFQIGFGLGAFLPIE